MGNTGIGNTIFHLKEESARHGMCSCASSCIHFHECTCVKYDHIHENMLSFLINKLKTAVIFQSPYTCIGNSTSLLPARVYYRMKNWSV